MAAAISDREERDNFFRLTLLLFRVGNQRLRAFFKSQWPTVYQNATGAPPPVVPWSDTPNDSTEMKNVQTKLKFQFKDQEDLFNSGNTNNWDFSLLTTVLMNSSLKFVTAASPEYNAIKYIKDIRNEHLCHAPDARIQSTVFSTEWPKACQALKHFNATQGEFDGVMEDVKKPIDSLVPILKECLTLENGILDVINELEEKNELRHNEVIESIKDLNETINEGEAKNELRHKEVIETIKQESEDTKKLITEVKQGINECNEPKTSGSKQIKMKETARALIQQRLEYFKYDVIATELFDYLPRLTQEQKDEITNIEKNYTTVKALGTLVEKLEEFEDGFQMLVRALLRAGLGHVAVLLDPNCTDYDEPSTDDEDIHSYVSIDGTAFDIRIPLRILVADVNQREMELEEQIALKFSSSSSPDSRKLRKEFNKVLPKEVHFVHTTQLGGRTNQNTRSEDTAATDAAAADNPAKTIMDSVVLVFRVAKVPALDMLWDAYTNGDLKKLVREVIIPSPLLKPSNGGAGTLELEMVFQEKHYIEIRTILDQGEAEIDEESRPSTEGGEDETMETSGDTYLPKETTRIRKVYLEDNYHKEIQLRDYQKELAAPTLGGQNTVICAPTNSGKTFVAMEIAKRHLDSACNDSRKAKVVFVVNKQNLVFQQRARFEEYLTKYKISDISGSNSTSISLESLLNTCDVVVLTAQILVDALKENRVKITDISLLLFDECHHTQKDDSYNMIMKTYIRMKRANGSGESLPQVVGFTASLGVGQGTTTLEKAVVHTLQICANLDAASNISTVRENKEDLQKHVTGDTLDVEVIEVSNDNPNIFEVEVNKTMKEIEVHLKQICKYDDPPTDDRQTERYRQWIELLQDNTTVNSNSEQFICAEHLRSYHEALLINSYTRITDATAFLEDSLNEDDQCAWLHEVYQETKTSIDQTLNSDEQTRNALLLEMEKLIVGFHESETESTAKGIVFCRTKAYAVALKKWIHETANLKDTLKPDILIGSSGEQYSMTRPEQEAVIKKFKTGDVNIIIATSVAEEGLDIADCIYVIRYGVKTNEISHVQSRGRVRAKKGSYVYLCDKKSRGAEHERKNQSKETLMNAAVEEVQKMSSKEFFEKIQHIQANTVLAIEKKKSDSASAKSAIKETESVSFLCRKCNKLICYAHNIRTIYNDRVVVTKDIYERIDIKPHEKPYKGDKQSIFEKIYCKKCVFDLGVVITLQAGTKWPCIKIKSFKVQRNDCQPTIHNKWKDCPYIITEVRSFEELIAEQEGLLFPAGGVSVVP